MGFDISMNYKSAFISAEQKPDRGSEDIRRDISIVLKYEKSKQIVVVIEAKNLSLKTTRSNAHIENKLSNSYLSGVNYSDCDVCNDKFGVTLTKERMIFSDHKIFSLLWEDILRILIELENDDHLIFEFKEHIMNTDLIKTYEAEIMSPACGSTYKRMEELNLYCCPADRTLKDSIYLLPRIPVKGNEQFLEDLGFSKDYIQRKKGKGFATRLYKIKSSFIVDRSTIDAIEDINLRSRVKEWYNSGSQEERLQVFELTEESKFFKPIFTDLQNNADTRYLGLRKILEDINFVLNEVMG